MPANPKSSKRSSLTTAIIEIAFIIFLFYSNLLMGEFLRSNPIEKTFTAAVYNIFDLQTFAIALIAASIGFVAFDYLRKRL